MSEANANLAKAGIYLDDLHAMHILPAEEVQMCRESHEISGSFVESSSTLFKLIPNCFL